MTQQPYTVRQTTARGRPAELLTFMGTTEEEYDQFLDARFADGREPLGFKQDAGAVMRQLDSGRSVWCQFRRLILEVKYS